MTCPADDEQQAIRTRGTQEVSVQRCSQDQSKQILACTRCTRPPSSRTESTQLGLHNTSFSVARIPFSDHLCYKTWFLVFTSVRPGSPACSIAPRAHPKHGPSGHGRRTAPSSPPSGAGAPC